MNDEKDEFVNTEEPIEVSDEELKMLMEASAQIDRGEVKSQEEVEMHIQQLLDEYENASYESILAKKKELQRIRTVNEI